MFSQSRPSVHPITAAFLAIICALLVAVALSPAQAEAEVHEITEGELNWGIKESWRNYTGGGHVSEGASLNEDGTFKFPLVSGTFDDETNTTVLSFQGKVWFRSWWEYSNPGQWALDDTFYDFKVVISPTQQIVRASHIGYAQNDPGGELHVFEDGVVGKIQIGDGEFVSADGQTNWNDFRTLAGPDLGLYTEGSVIDRVSFSYSGPGGVPDTGEKWDTPGTIGMTAGERFVSDYPRENWTVSNRQLFVSDDGESLHLAEIKGANGNTPELRITQLDPESMEQTGDALIYNLKQPIGSNSYGRYFRFAFDQAGNNLYFVLAGQGEDFLGTWVMAAEWDAETGEYQVSKVGELPPAVQNESSVAGTPLGEMIWNPVNEEIAVFASATASTGPFDRASLFRFKHDGAVWNADEINLKAPTDGEYAAAVGISPPWHSGYSAGAITTMGDLTTTRSGSYLFASGTSYYTVPNPDAPPASIQVPLDAAEIIVEGDEATVRYVDGTALGPHPGFGTRYGWSGVSQSHDGSNFIHNSSWGRESFIRLDVVDGVTEAVGDVFMADYDLYPPSGVATLAQAITPDPVHGLDWVTDPSNPDSNGFHALRNVEGEDRLVSSHNVEDNPPPNWSFWSIRVNPASGDIYVPVQDEASQGFGYQRFSVDGFIAEPGEQPEDAVVSLGIGETSQAVEFKSTVVGGDPVPTRQWQIRAPGDSQFVDIEGETGETLDVDAVAALDGYEYRAVYTSPAGSFPSEVATLSVFAAPVVVNDVVDQAILVGEDASFSVMPQGNPAPEITWQRQAGGFWQNIDLDSDQFEVGGETGGFLTVKNASADMSGAKFRVRLRNKITPGSDAWSTVYSQPATLTVTQASNELVAFDGGHVDWGFANRWRCYVVGQIAHGHILVEDGATRVPGTLATGGLCAPPNNTGSEIVRFPVDSGEFNPDTGELAIDLDGSVQFQGHLMGGAYALDTLISDLRIRVDADGNGEVIVDATGANMSSPEPQLFDDVTIVEFDGEALASQVAATGSFSGIPTLLHEQGVDIFGSYPAGEPFDPLGGELEAVDTTPVEPYPPSITSQPEDLLVVEGDDAEFRVEVDANPAAAIQWQMQVAGIWMNIPDALGDTFTVASATLASNGALLRARIEGSGTVLHTNAVTLRVTRAVTETVRLNGGHVDWGIANRWRCYVVGQIAHGHILTAGGATQVPGTLATGSLCGGVNNAGSEIVRFPVRSGEYNPVTGELDIELRGSVQFQGHNFGGVYALDTLISDLRIRVDANGNGEVIVDATGANMSSPEPQVFDDVVLVNFDGSDLLPYVSDQGIEFDDIPTFLDEEGVDVFGSYPAGEPFDPLGVAPNELVATAPVVTVQPEDQTVVLPVRTGSAEATFEAEATGAPDPTIQWQTRANPSAAWTDVDGATGTEITATVNDAADGRQYRAVFTNEAGEVASEPAGVVIGYAPVQQTAPATRTVNEGASTSLTGAMYGKPAPALQFQFCEPAPIDCNVEENWVDIEGATASPFGLTPGRELNGYRYRLKGTNEHGVGYSLVRTLTVRFAPSIDSPADVLADEGEEVVFTTTFSGGNPTTVSVQQWQVCVAGDDCEVEADWVNIAGATTGTLTVVADADVDGNQYRWRATHTVGAQIGEPATLEVHYKPQILEQPEDVIVLGGETGGFALEQRSNPAATYQWQVCAFGADCDLDGEGWVDMADAESDSIEIPTSLVDEGDYGALYRAVLTNANGTTFSDPVTLDVHYAPQVISEPSDAEVEVGEDAEYEIDVIGSPAPVIEWQWWLQGFWEPIGPGNDDFVIDGGRLVIKDTNIDMSGARFRARVYNERGTDYTEVVSLVVVDADQVQPDLEPDPDTETGSVSALPEITFEKVKQLKQKTSFAILLCPENAESDCSISVPDKVKFKASGKLTKSQKKQLAKRLKIGGRGGGLATGKRQHLILKLTPAQRKALKGKRLKGKVRIGIATGGQTAVKTVQITAKVK